MFSLQKHMLSSCAWADKGTGYMLDRSHIFPALLLILNSFVNMFKGYIKLLGTSSSHPSCLLSPILLFAPTCTCSCPLIPFAPACALHTRHHHLYLLVPFMPTHALPHNVAPECLSLRISFSLKEEFLDTSNSLVGCVLHQNIIVFIQVLMQMQCKWANWIYCLNHGIGQEGHIWLNYWMCPSFWLNYRMCLKTLLWGRNSFSNWGV